MKNKILITALIILAAAFIFENAYLLGQRSRDRLAPLEFRRYHAPIPRPEPVRFSLPEQEVRTVDPFAEMDRMQEKMNSLSSAMNKATPGGTSFETAKEAYIIKASLPGFDKRDIDIQVKGRQLNISAENNKDAAKEKGADNQEFSYGTFRSSFFIPEDAVIKQMKTDYKDGFLTITIPREVVSKGK